MKHDRQVFRMRSKTTRRKWEAFCRLQNRENWRTYKKSCRALDFLGCKFYPDGHLELRKSILKRVKRKAKRICKLGSHVNARNAAGMMAYIGGTIKLRRIISDDRKLQRETKGNMVRGAA